MLISKLTLDVETRAIALISHNAASKCHVILISFALKQKQIHFQINLVKVVTFVT